MVAAVQTGATFVARKPVVVFDDLSASSQAGGSRFHDVTPDGQRFVIIKDQETGAANQFVVVENWFEELKARVLH